MQFDDEKLPATCIQVAHRYAAAGIPIRVVLLAQSMLDMTSHIIDTGDTLFHLPIHHLEHASTKKLSIAQQNVPAAVEIAHNPQCSLG